MKKLQLLLLTLITASPAWAQEQEQEQEPLPAPVPLSQLAAQADLVALVRVLDTDYEYTREFPSGGTAFLEVLIPYKVKRPVEDVLEVYEEGLHAGECYFENPSVLEEGRRYLVFLQFSKEFQDQYNGLAAGCKLEVLVNRDNRYALRYPVSGIRLADDLQPHASRMDFADNYALVPDEEISPVEREQLLAAGFLLKQDQSYRFTHGIELSTIRQLMGPDALTLDRTLK